MQRERRVLHALWLYALHLCMCVQVQRQTEVWSSGWSVRCSRWGWCLGRAPAERTDGPSRRRLCTRRRDQLLGHGRRGGFSDGSGGHGVGGARVATGPVVRAYGLYAHMAMERVERMLDSREGGEAR